MHTLPATPLSTPTPLTAVEVSLACLDHHTHRAAVAHFERLSLMALITADWNYSRMVTTTGPCR